MIKRVCGCVFCLAAALLVPVGAHAYVDPTTGSWIFQLLFPVLSAVVAVAMFFRDGFRRVLDMLLRRKKDAPGDE